jgi:hypothetical protein
MEGSRRNGVYEATMNRFSESAGIVVTRTVPILGKTTSPLLLTGNSPDKSGSRQIISFTASPGCSGAWVSATDDNDATGTCAVAGPAKATLTMDAKLSSRISFGNWSSNG